MSQLSSSKQQTHRWLQRLELVFGVVTVASFLYALYASVVWQQVGEKNVVMAWLVFLLCGAPIALLMGIDILMLSAVPMTPGTGQVAALSRAGIPSAVLGWGLIVFAALLALVILFGIGETQAGRFGLEAWIKFIVTFSVGLGILTGGIAFLRRLLRRS